ncbi:MAG: family 16 glycosylhydrolase [Chloroflexi bacterium]|nr:family 16 glycosylhydrolase [Chloroflexota bacterium]MBP8059764.1 family 16 glycosylhydrolase [Chloroflexota bacterium]
MRQHDRQFQGRSWLPMPWIFLLVLFMGLVACQDQPGEEATATSVPPTLTPALMVTPTSETEPVVEAGGENAAATQLPLVDNFEMGELPSGQAGFATVGFLTWSDGSAVSIAPTVLNDGDSLARPEQTSPNTVVQLDTAVGQSGWAGFTHAFANDALDTWQPQDWSAYAGMALWLYGNNTGGTLFIDLLDNRSANSTGDDAERWTHNIPDDFSGWAYFEIPFTDFRRKDIGNGAPNDGLTLTAVHGYAVGTFGTVPMGPQSVYVDEVQVYGVAPIRPVEVVFLEAAFNLRETGRATVIVNLTKPAEEIVTVNYEVAYGVATPGVDYEFTPGTLTFAPGETDQTFILTAIDDLKAEGREPILLVLTQPVGAQLGFQRRAVLTITDNDPADPNLLFDFDVAPPFVISGTATLSTLAVNPSEGMALPEQVEAENVLQVDYVGASTLGQTFAAAQDWSGYTGLSFWYYGQNSGQTLTVQLLDNQTVTTANTPVEQWQMLWSDEFDGVAGSFPTPSIWRPEIGDGTLNGNPGWGNGELETYTNTPENVALDGNGNLVITAHELGEDTNLACHYGTCEYSSARLITWDRLETTYGRVEARMQLPQGQGIWPAFWMLGTNLDEVGWPQSGEIDIMENIGREPSTVHGTVHGPGYSGSNGIGGGYDLDSGLFADDFHIFAIEWTPDGIRWFVDGVNYFSLTPDQIPAGTEWVYDHPFFIILNLAVGGNWPGFPDDTTVFPQSLVVDYVRVYGAPNQSEQFSATFVDDFSGWQKITLPFDQFTRSEGQVAAAAADGLTLTQVWGYRFITPASAGILYLDKLRFE